MKVDKVLNSIIEDSSIMKLIKFKIDEIIEDGKIDYKDIPHFIEIIIIVLRNTNKLKSIKKNEIKDIMKEIIIYILKDNNLYEDNKEIVNDIINNSLNLIELGSSLKKCLCF
jgi:hypothetical protein